MVDNYMLDLQSIAAQGETELEMADDYVLRHEVPT